MILQLAALALNAAYDAIPDPLWANIDIEDPATEGTNSDAALTFVTGPTRTISVSFPSLSGALFYRINSGSYVFLTSGDTFSVSSGDTVGFYFVSGATTGLKTVTVRDVTRGSNIGSFTVRRRSSV